MNLAGAFLYRDLDSAVQNGFLTIRPENVPAYLREGLNPRFELRPYQEEAFARFFHCFENSFQGKEKPLHLLFNMATGSGKTLIMAGLILYLYEKGYRNFLFFVHSTNIIQKTRDNFLNPLSSKYLFNKSGLRIDGRRPQIVEVANFEGVHRDDINIRFTTIQQLHLDLKDLKEGSVSYEDFQKSKTVLIADEAHHMSAATKSQRTLMESWENTVEGIFQQNEENLLLEFTATQDYEISAMVEKYRRKVIYRYGLAEFRLDGYSKDVIIVKSDLDRQKRILQALVLSEYKQEVAAKHQIQLKPVLLFKAQRTIAQSEENKAEFHELIDGLDAEKIDIIRRSNVPVVQRAFRFFNENGISSAQLAQRLKREFQENRCLSVNSKDEHENAQMLVNSLEDKDNRIRAVFAVQKLNEGWDVLNLFDIVRCYEKRDSGGRGIGKTTMAEAQLIGRGARYFPFVLPDRDDRYRRKFDSDLENELRILEELHYHSVNDSRYISEIQAALAAKGIFDEKEERRKLKVKKGFKQSDMYKFGVVWRNKRQKKLYDTVASFENLGVSRKNYAHPIASTEGAQQYAMGNKPMAKEKKQRVDVRIPEFDRNIVEVAVGRNPFFTFASLKRFFPHLHSMRRFRQDKAYLGGLTITFEGTGAEKWKENRAEQLAAVSGMLNQLEAEVKKQATEYEGSRLFWPEPIRETIKDKTIKVDDRKLKGEEQIKSLLESNDWYVFDSLYGTSEERGLVELISEEGFKERLRKSGFRKFFPIRNERHFKLYRFLDGQGFEPDFLLIAVKENGESIVHEVFIEPKGMHLQEQDRWKEDMLKEIRDRYGKERKTAHQWQYRIAGAPFYNKQNENEFLEKLFEALEAGRDPEHELF